MEENKKATLVGAEHFVGDILVVNGANPNSGAGFDLCYFIEKYEPKYLSDVLGYEFYLNIIQTVEADPENVPDEYADLICGADYRDANGVLHHWKGLIGFTADYIYYWYKRNDFTSSTGVGEANAAVENGVFRTSDQKMVRAYNESMDGVIEARNYLKSLPADTFPLYDPTKLYCFNFLDQDKINVFGL